jgi:polyisoprenoid-binding protein YceI
MLDARAALFMVDGSNSSASFHVGYWGHGIVKGVLSRLSGKVELDVTTKEGGGDIVFDMTMVETGNAITNRFIKSGNVFDIEKFPSMTFRATRFDYDGERLMAVNGDLTLHGVTRAIRLEARQFACADVAVADAARQFCHGEFTTVVYRSHFGMNRFRLLVNDDVLINVNLVLERLTP